VTSPTPSSIDNNSITNTSFTASHQNGTKIQNDKDDFDAAATLEPQFNNKYIKVHVLSDSDDEHSTTFAASPDTDTNVAITSTTANPIAIVPPIPMVETNVDDVGVEITSVKDENTTTHPDAYDTRHGLGNVRAATEVERVHDGVSPAVNVPATLAQSKPIEVAHVQPSTENGNIGSGKNGVGNSTMTATSE
jgi:hypothetical protein